MSHEQTVMSLYDAFQRADLPAILNLVADDVVWRNDGVASAECPWNANYSGKAKLPGFFTGLAEHVDLPVFDIKDTVAAGPHVVVRLRIEGRVKKNGRTWGNDAVHFWTFDSRGKVARYQHFNDTAAELAAWRG